MLTNKINLKKVISQIIILFSWLTTYGISINPPTSTGVKCFNGTDGTITVVVSGATNNLTYYLYDNIPVPGPATLLSQSGSTPLTSWTFDTNAINAGTYYVYVVESITGSSSGGFVTVTQPAAALSYSITNQINLSCFGTTIGSVTVAGSNGWGSYQYNIDGGTFQPDPGKFDNLAGGAHTVILKDIGGCQITIPVNITSPPQLVGSISSQTNDLCNGDANGSVTISVSGGTPGYTYLWGGGAPATGKTTASLTLLPAGTYTCTITDTKSCNTVVPVTITQPAVLNGTISVFKDLTCYDGSDATLQANPTGGTAPYTYIWSASSPAAAIAAIAGQTGQQATLLPQGTYSCKFNDANNCGSGSHPAVLKTIQYLKTWPAGVNIPAQIVINPNPPATTDACLGQTNGTINIVASGGTGSLSYSIITGGNGSYQGTGLFNVGAGTYEIWVEDTKSCKAQGTSVTINSKPLPTATITPDRTTVDCTNPTANLTAAGGTSYLWNTGAVTATIAVTPVANTTYTVTVTGANGCTATASQAITVNKTPPTATITPDRTTVDCTNPTANLTAAGGTSYLWSTGAVTAAIAVTPVANTTYTVTVTGANGCTATASQAIVADKTPPSAAITPDRTTVTCSNPSATLTVPLVAGNTYLWSTGALTNAITVSPVINTTYSVTVTATNGCSANSSQAIAVNQTPPTATITPDRTTVDCTNPTANLTAAGGTSYLWSTGAVTATIAVTPVANTTYTVTVTGANGCTATASQAITVNKTPPTATITPDRTTVDCTNPTANLTAAGGTSYLWSTGAVTATIAVTPVANTTYTVTVTGANGCTATASQAITVNKTPPTATITPDRTTVDCTNPTANLTAAGGTSYLWSTGAVTAAIAVTPVANTTYTVTVTGANGCTATASQAIVADKTPPSAAITPDRTTVTCSNPSATLTVPLVAGNTYLWSTGALTNAITVSPVINTTYSVTVTATNGCSANSSQAIAVNQTPPTATITPDRTTVDCTNPTANLTAAGGTSYLWSTGAVTATIAVTPVANTTYTVTVTGANGCTATASQAITVNKTPPTATITPDRTTVDCTNPTANLTAAGGTSYLWSTGAVTATIAVTPVANTTYTVTVTGANGCTATASQAITVNKTPPTATITPDRTTVDCTNPTANLTAAGGTSYLWSTGAVTAAIAVTPVANTTYTVTVTGANGCTATASQAITVNQTPPTATITPDRTTVDCTNPTANLTAAGGTSYLWSTGAVTATIAVTPVANTTYTVTVTGANGCTATASQAITVNKTPPTATITPDRTTVDCTNPTANLTAAGGTSYLWNTGAVTATIAVTPVANTTYTVTVTGANGCTATASQAITVNKTPPTATITPDRTTVDCTNPTANLTAAGGTSYLWSTGAVTAAIAVTPVANTTYTVTVTGANGCTATASQAIVADKTPPSAAITPDRTTVTCSNPSATLAVPLVAGNTYLWSTGALTNAITVSPVINTTYSVTVTATNGCSANSSQAITVNQTPPTATITPDRTTVDCTNPTANLTAAGGTSYLWSTGAVTATIAVTPVANTTYTVTVTGANGCTATASQAITVNKTPPTATITPDRTTVDCTNPTANLTAAGGTSYLWSTGAVTATIAVTPVANTTYTVTVTGANGCTATASQAITVNKTPPTATITPDRTTVDCTNPTANLTAAGGTSYLWSTGAVTAAIAITPVANTTYTVTVTGANGCTATASQAIVADKTPPSAAITPDRTTVTCSNPSATLTVPLVAGNTYLWSTGALTNAITVSPVINTTYSVTVTATNGCSANSSQAIAVNQTPPTATITPDRTTVDCTNPTANLTAAGGTSYLWSTGAVTATIAVTPVANTTYTVTVTGANGCTATASQAITVNKTPPTATITPDRTTVDCTNPTANLTAAGGTSYLWSTGAVTATIAVTPVANTTYTVTVTGANGCTATASQAIMVDKTPPTVTITVAETSGTTNNDGIICNGATAVLTATGGISYVWNTGAATASISVSPAINTTYDVTVTAINGCTSNTNQIITVNSLPTTSITLSETSGTANDDGIICSGAPVMLTASGGTSYLWSSGQNTATISVSPAATSTYNVTVTNANGCTAVASQLITVNPNPSPTLAGSSPACQGSTGNIYTSDAGMSNYIWNVSAGGTITSGGGITDNTVTVTWNVPGSQTVSVNYSNINGCSATTPSSFNVTVDANPIANAGPDDEICYNAAYMIPSASVTNATSFTWKTLGDGTFNDITLLNPIYTPSDNDKANGSVKLVLEAVGAATCINATDTLKLLITPKLDASIGALAPFPLVFTGGPNDTKVKISFATQDYEYIQGLSYYLVSPDGSKVVTLNEIPDPFVLPCAAIFSLDADSVSFVNDATYATLDICNNLFGPSQTLKGTFNATGNWSVLNGLNPASGGWKLMVKDRGNGVAAPGYMKFASLTFIKGNATSAGDTVTFNSGSIHIDITQGNVIDPAITSFTVPRSLTTKCSSSCDAKAVVNVTGGKAPYTFQWSSGTLPAKDTVDLCKGTYTVTVTDLLGCSTTATVDVTSPAPIVIDSIKFTPNDTVNCFGGTASVTAYLKGGTGLLKYTVNGVTKNNKQVINGIPAGTYPLHIFDANGCTKDTSITIYEPTQFYADSLQIHNVTCNGANNGILEARGHNGSKPYTFILEKGGIAVGLPRTSNDSIIFRNLSPANNYQIRVFDKFGCKPDTFKNIAITQPAILNIDNITTSNFVCYGKNDGSIVFQQVSGGTRPYLYSIDNGANWLPDSSFKNLMPAVTYHPIVKDNNNCSATTLDITLPEANQMLIDSLKVTHVTSCYSNAEGAIKVYASGGDGMLQFSLNDITFQPDSTFRNLLGGNYTVYVKDTLTKCEINSSTTINRPSQIVIDSIKHTNVNGVTKGTITIFAKGGTGSLEYSIDSTNYTPSNFFSNVDAGKYYIYVRDANGCKPKRDSVTINSMTVNVTHTNVNCKGKNTGTITIKASGGITFKYSIDAGITTQDSGIFINLAANNYPIRVVNTTTLAQFDTTILITEPDTALMKGVVLFNDPSCYGSNEGKIIIAGAKGEMPLQYSINGGVKYQDSNQFSALFAGNYKVMVKDINNCMDSTLTSLNNPLPIKITAQIINVRGSTMGSIKITSVQNGTAPFKFALNGGAWNTTDSTFTGLTAGSYTITTLENLYNCRRDTVLFVGTDANLNIKVSPNDDSIKCNGDFKGELFIDVIDPKATPPIRYQITGRIIKDTTDNSGQNQIRFKNLPGGTYNITVTDATGLTANDVEILNNPSQISITLDSINRPLCNTYNNNKGDIYIHANGGAGNYRFLWSNNSITQNQIAVPGDKYWVNAFDNNNCYVTDTVYLIPYHQLTVSAGIDLAACPGDGINLQGLGSSTDPSDVLIYEWVPGKFLDDSTLLMPLAKPPSGIYTYTLRAHVNAGCSATDDMKLHIWPTYNFRVGIQDIYGQLSFDNPATVRKNTPIQLEALPDSLTNYTWMISDMLNLLKIMDNPLSRTPIVTLTDSTRFFVTAITPEGCPVNTQIYLKIAGPLKIPSGFTPNGDGTNDYWKIGEAEGYPDIEVEVFNRWGSKVYSSKGYNDAKNFDGTLNGKPLPMGTYYYIIKIPGYDLYKGTVTIVR